LNDAVDAWYQGWARLRGECVGKNLWMNMTNIIEEFNKFKQVGMVSEYQSNFEELKALMIITNPSLFEAYFVSSLRNGLSEELRPTVKIL